MQIHHALLGALLFNATVALAQQAAPAAPAQPLGFFVTSSGLGKGADLGGLSGADAHCQKLASAVGAGNRTWRAYLSTQAANGQPAVNARDRIGTGPWANAKGQIVARDVAHLHGDVIEQARLGNNLSRTTVITEKGDDPVEVDEERLADQQREEDLGIHPPPVAGSAPAPAQAPSGPQKGKPP